MGLQYVWTPEEALAHLSALLPSAKGLQRVPAAVCSGVAQAGAAVQHPRTPRSSSQFCSTASRHLPQQQMRSWEVSLCRTSLKIGLTEALCNIQAHVGVGPYLRHGVHHLHLCPVSLLLLPSSLQPLTQPVADTQHTDCHLMLG